MQTNGQYQQAGQLQLAHPGLNYNANGSNQRYENKASSNGRGALEDLYTMCNAGVSAQQQNNYLALNNPLPASHQDYYKNSAQMATNQSNTHTVTLNQQVILSQTSSMSGNPHGAALNNKLYYQSLFHLQNSTLNQSVKPSTDNVSLQRTNPTSSTMQNARFTQQSALQSPMYSQASKHAAPPPPYPQHVNFAFSNVPSARNFQIYSVTPVALLSTSSLNNVVANNPRMQNPYFVSQTNDNGAINSVNGCTNLSNQMVANNANSQSNFLTVPIQTQRPSHDSQHLQQTGVGGNVNKQIAQPVNLVSEGNGLNPSSAPLPSQTCLQKRSSTESNLKSMSTASLHISTAKDQPVNQVDSSILHHKTANVSNSLPLYTSPNAPSELSRGETLSKIDTVSSAQAKDCSLQVSPSRAMRAVAVVLPLSQDGSPSKHSSASSLRSSNPASDSCSFSSNQLDKAPVQTPDTCYLKQKLQNSTSNGSNISTDNANVQANSPLNSKQSNVHDAGPKLSSLPLTFAQLVEGKLPAKVPGRRKSKSGNRKTATGQKPCEEELSSLPTTEWTLKMLYEKVLELENKDSEKKPYQTDNPAKEIIVQFWNGDCKVLLKEIKTGSLSNEMSMIRDFCSKTDFCNTVIFSQNQSKHPSRYHVLSHGEVYEEKKPYTSVWLNINQLDDIDKEFGLPLFLRSSQDDYKSVDAEPKSQLESSSHTEIKLAILKPEELLNKEDSPNQSCSSPSMKSLCNSTDSERKDALRHLDPETEEKAEEFKCVSDTQLNDSSYSFKIEVMPPEEAKVIFKQIECESPQIEDIAVSKQVTPNKQDGVENIAVLKEVASNEEDGTENIDVSKEDIPNEQDGTENIAISKEVTPNKQDGAENIAVLKEVTSNEEDGAENIGVSKEDMPNEEDGADSQKYHIAPIEKICCIEKWKEKVFGLSSEGKCKCAEESQDEKKVVKSEIENCWHMGTVDLTGDGDDDIPLFPQESDNAEGDQKLISAITVSSGRENESQVSENNHATSTDHYSDHEHDLVIATESQEGMSTNKNVFETANPAFKQAVSGGDDVKENDQRLTSGNPGPLLHPLKLNKLSSNLKTQTILESFSKSKIGGLAETVELALFGSKHKKTASRSSLQSHVQSTHDHTHSFSEKTVGAPKRLYVKFNFTKSDKQEAEPSGNDSVKKRIHESWRNSFPLTTIRLKRKNKKYAIVSATHGTTIQLSSTKYTEKRVASKRKSRDSDDGQSRKKRFRSDERTVNTLQKPAGVEARPRQENVLKFDVLPNTFNFKERSCDTDSKTDSKSDEKTVPVPPEGSPFVDPAGGNSPSVPTEGNPSIDPAEGNPSSVNTKGAWCDESTSKSPPRSSASVPESIGLFQEFQRRFKMRQSSADD